MILLNRGTNNNVWWILSILLKSICKKQILNDSQQIFDMKNQDSEIATYYVPTDLIKQLEFWVLNLYIKLLQMNCRFRIVQQMFNYRYTSKLHSLLWDNSYTRKGVTIVSFLWIVHLKLLGELNKLPSFQLINFTLKKKPSEVVHAN